MSKQADLEEWRRLAEGELGAGAEPLAGAETPEGIRRKPLYTRADLDANADAFPVDSIPGAAPFLRGVRASMYTGRPWTVRQYAGFSTARESNAFYRRCLAAGQTGLSVAFDLATHRGFDSDHPRVVGDVGKAGVAIDSVEDMALLFDGIPLDRTSVSMTMNGAVLPVFAMFIVAGEEQGVKPARLSGTIQNDILKEFMVRNTYIYPPEPSMRIVGDVIEYASRHLPRFNPVSISGYHMHEAGAPAHLELAFTLADGLEYVRTALAHGLVVDEFAPRLSFFFAVGSDFFTEVAKLRAARWLWARLMQEQFQPRDPASCKLRMHCQTSGISLTAQQPHNNIVRTTLQALAAVLGGTQSLHTNAFDEALALPSDFAAALARNTQLILQHETGLDQVIDPLGGSYYVEALTRQLGEQALEIIREVEAAGGMTRAVAEGWPKLRILSAATRRQARVERGLDVIVGVNRYTTDARAEPAVELRTIDNQQVRSEQIERLARVKAKRDAAEVRRHLDALSNAALEPRSNLVELAIHAARARATLGEISGALERAWGRYSDSASQLSGSYGEYYAEEPRWLALQRRIQEFERQVGRRPRLLVAKLGQDGHDRGARLIASAFADAGFDVDVGPLFQTPDEVAQQAVDNDVHAVGVSTQAGAHLTLVPALVARLQQLGAGDIVTVCGGVIPEADHPALLAAGVRDIFGPGTPIVEAIARLLDELWPASEAAPAAGATGAPAGPPGEHEGR
ncbi:MAG TPA: methylmalonyl-CoA mutase [Polyangiaceae bacterium]|jgi:methylmalonyl-CoA mutase|nr:methylmalonyl-CoA mutase [Polyangiaceae bacterium]